MFCGNIKGNKTINTNKIRVQVGTICRETLFKVPANTVYIIIICKLKMIVPVVAGLYLSVGSTCSMRANTLSVGSY